MPCYSATLWPKRTKMIRQRTIKRAIKSTGVGLHTGTRSSSPCARAARHRHRLPPRRPRSSRSNRPGARGDRHALGTALERGGAKVATVEHLMSALVGLGIDNVYIDLVGRRCRSWTAARAVRVPAAVGGDRGAARAKALLPGAPSGRGRRGRQVGAARALRGFKVAFSIVFDHPVFDARPSR